ncbi:MAG: AAA family ATPase [Gammaproteobacteria bacterium]|nr:AAA family ATPase [Gammaproteobacteria bacterium]
MYAAFFGLTEPPFSIAPDPRYLYLSDRHSEARAHLLYGLEHGSGFVQLTGEVGTGKTTLCRSVLLALPESIEVALILNPRINEYELLQTLCDELRVNYTPGLSPKQIVDRLNHHLLQIHAEGRRTVLIIDEAQNLSREVLEQIRLLTNLETNKEKLLQIILIGQPELVDLLARPDLRQLSQRVTARYHLAPLSRRETAGFVNHRLLVAGCERRLFSDSAIRRVHRLSKGIPRVINLICDRALLGAYSQSKRKVSAGIMKKAAREVLGHGAKSNWFTRPTWWFGFVIIGLLLPLRFHYSDSVSDYSDPADDENTLAVVTESPIGQLHSAPNLLAEPATVPVTKKSVLPQVVQSIADLPSNSYADAMTAAVARWGQDNLTIKDCADVSSAGLQCHYRKDGLTGLRHYNRPAVLILRTGERVKYPLLLEISSEQALFEISNRRYSIAMSAIETQWDGGFIVLWRPPSLAHSGDSKANNFAWLQRALDLWSMQIDGVLLPLDSTTNKDDALRKNIERFQRWHGIAPNGVVGVDMLIELNTVLAGEHIPVLTSTDDKG